MTCCNGSQIFEIFQGDAKVLPLSIVYENSFLPLDLTNCKQIIVQLPLSAGGFTALTLTSGVVAIAGTSPLLGQVAVNISSAISSSLNVASLQDIFSQFIITDGTDVSIVDGVVGQTAYCITSLGNTTQTQWEAIGLPSTVTAAIGVTFIANATGPGIGTGVVQALTTNSPMTVPFRKCFTVFEE